MALILNIDTSTETAGVFLAFDGKLINSSTNSQQNDHASWIHGAIDKLIIDAGYSMKNLEAVAVSAGPGSYTGLRVGMATAKGICYALNIPLITENSLKLMAAAFIAQKKAGDMPASCSFCPLIDARRMEVFRAVFDSDLNEILPPAPFILDTSSFQQELDAGAIVFFGSGAAKWHSICHHPNAYFEPLIFSGDQFVLLTYSKFLGNEFTVLAYAEPVYLKDFYTHPK